MFQRSNFKQLHKKKNRCNLRSKLNNNSGFIGMEVLNHASAAVAIIPTCKRQLPTAADQGFCKYLLKIIVDCVRRLQQQFVAMPFQGMIRSILVLGVVVVF
jgi:hypothetical protein